MGVCGRVWVPHGGGGHVTRWCTNHLTRRSVPHTEALSSVLWRFPMGPYWRFSTGPLILISRCLCPLFFASSSSLLTDITRYYLRKIRVLQKELGKRSSITFFRFRDSFGHFLVTFSDASVTFFVTFFAKLLLPDSFCGRVKKLQALLIALNCQSHYEECVDLIPKGLHLEDPRTAFRISKCCYR